jgi:Zn-finger nucleic acid-binding protein
MSETLQEIKCPACQKIMTKVFIPKEGVNIDICLNGCGGMYFDNRELTYFDEQNEGIDEILNTIVGKNFEKIEQSNFRTCPSCGARMVKNFSSAKKQIQIDECYSCGGKFLDASELQSLRGEYATEAERSADVMALINATVGPELIKMDQEHQEALKHRSALKKLFDSIVDKAPVW